MKSGIKIIHLSDFHIQDGFMYEEIENGFSNIISNSISTNDTVIMLFTGDLTFSGTNGQFEIFKDFFLRIHSFIQSKCSSVLTYFVPGNHDCNFNNRVGNELNDYYCFCNDIKRISRSLTSNEKTIVTKTQNINNKKITITMLNSAKYCDSGFHDCGNLKLDINEIKKHILTLPEADYKILILHHQIGVFDTESKICLDKLYELYDIVFDGHEHNPITKEVSKGGISYALFDGGAFWDINSKFSGSSFGIYELLEEKVLQKTYVWNSNSYERLANNLISIKKSGEGALLKRTQEFERDFFTDDLAIFDNIIDGFEDFEICKLTDANSDDRFSFSFKESISSIIKDTCFVELYGKDFTSKTMSLKYIYRTISKDFVPIYLKRENFFGCKNQNDVRKVIQKQATEQYNYKNLELDNIDKSRIIILLDDFDKIPSTIKHIVLDYILLNYKYAVLTCTYDPFDQKRLDNNDDRLSNYLIEDMSHRTMLAMIKSSIKRLLENNTEDSDADDLVESTLSALDNNLSSFKHIPFFVRSISKFVFFNRAGQNINGTSFSAIFDVNIKKIISDRFPDKSLDYTDTVITCLSEIAYSKYLTNSQYFSDEEINSFISDVFYKKEILGIKEYEIKSIILDTHIIVKKGSNYGFENRITYAYFVATKVEELSGYDPTGQFDYKEFTKNARNKIFVSINSEVLLFLIYKKYDISLIKEIIEDSRPYFDYDKNYNCFSRKYKAIGKEYNDSIVSLLEEYENNNKNMKRRIKEIDEQNDIFEGLDYNDFDKKYYSCLNYLRTLGTAFSGLYEKFDRDIKDSLTDILFDYPNIFLNYFLDVIDNVLYEEQMNIKKGDFSNIEISSKSLSLIKEIKRAMIVYTFDYVAKFCTNGKTYTKLMGYNKKQEDYIDFQKLMFAFYLGGTAFQNRLTEFAKKYENNKMCLSLAKITFYRFIERTEKYDLSYKSDLLDRLKIKKDKNRLLASKAKKRRI